MVVILLVVAAGFLLSTTRVDAKLPWRKLMENPELFEGDIIPSEILEKAYGINLDTNGQRSKRAAAIVDYLWPDGIIPFTFDSSVNPFLENLIYTAIDEYERETCLRFVYIGNSTEGDYIIFTEEDDGFGCSSYVGVVGGNQTITLPDYGENGTCQYYPIVLHEIGHAVGLFHEQGRPDRDRYVKILEENILEGLEDQFMKECECFVDYRGGKYDYGSVMHYEIQEFTNNDSVNTIEIINEEEYNQQGRPTLGEAQNLSFGDIFQLNRMYNCLPTSKRGDLNVFMGEASNVRHISDNSSIAELYALVTATDESGQQLSLYTASIPSTRSPVWNEVLSFGSSRWRYFEITIREHITSGVFGPIYEGDCERDLYGTDTATDVEVMCSQTIWTASFNSSSIQPINSGTLSYCTNVSTCVYFQYQLTLNGQPCYPNPCQNGGLCQHTFGGYRCNCRPGYVGRHCEEVTGGSCSASYICNNCADAYDEMCLGSN